MELRLYWRIVRRRWWLVVAPLVVVVVYVALTYTPPTPVYQVVMRYSAGTVPQPPSAGDYSYDRYYLWQASEYIANGLADVAKTGTFAEAVSARLAAEGIEVAATAVQGAIVTDNARSVLVVYLTWGDGSEAEAIAEAITAELAENGAAYFPQLQGAEPAVRCLDAPHPVALPAGLLTQLLGPTVRLGLALVVGLALAFLAHYLDPTIREAAELQALGIDVLAEIPRK